MFKLRRQSRKAHEEPKMAWGHVTLYTRQGCHLCEEAETLIKRLSQEIGFTWSAVDIETDIDLLRRYHMTIPVIAIDGEDALAAPLEEATVRAVLSRRLRLQSR